jgi:hypothetical protein
MPSLMVLPRSFRNVPQPSIGDSFDFSANKITATALPNSALMALRLRANKTRKESIHSAGARINIAMAALMVVVLLRHPDPRELIVCTSNKIFDIIKF